MDLIANIEPAAQMSAEANVVPNLQINVVQTTGTSTTDVMSQNAVSVELAARRTSAAQDVIDNAQTARIDDIIEKLKGNVYKTQDGASPAYIQSVPANSQSYSALGMIGGKTVGWNQLIVNGNFESTSGWAAGGSTIAVSNNIVTITPTNNNSMITQDKTGIAGHKYYASCFVKKTLSTDVVRLIVNSSEWDIYVESANTTEWQELSKIATLTTNNANYSIRGAAHQNAYSVKNARLFDLTAIFGSGNEPTSLSDSRISFIKAYASANPSYNAGTLLSAKTDAVKSVGANIWDEVWELGNINYTDGTEFDSSTAFRPKNYIKVNPNATYYFKTSNTLYLRYYDASYNYVGYEVAANNTRTMPSNVYNIRFVVDATTYNHDIQICLNSYSEKTTYHPYKSDSFPIPFVSFNKWDEEWEIGNYTSSGAKGTDTDCIRSKNKNKCNPSTTYYFKSSANAWLCFYDVGNNFISGVTISNGETTTPSNAQYFAFSMWSTYGATYHNDICLNLSQTDTSLALHNGVYAPYHKELEGYGQSAGNVDNRVDIETKLYRNMKRLDLSTVTWRVETGYDRHTILLPDAKMPSSGNEKANLICNNYWAATSVETRTNLNTIGISELGYLYVQTGSRETNPTGIVYYEAIDSTGTDYEARLYHKRVGEVDLGDLNWSYSSGATRFYVDVSSFGMKGTSTNLVKANIICAKEITDTWDNVTNNRNNKTIGLHPSATELNVYDTSYSDAAAFKTAMAGQKLQFELQTEQILDVTDKFSGDVFIEVENGGTVTFHQEGNVQLEIPNRNTYLVDVFGGY